MIPYYSDDTCTIYHGDCRGGADLVTDAAVVVTSPPYNVGVGYDVHDDVIGWDDYKQLANGTARAIKGWLMRGGRSWVNITPAVPATPIPAGDHSGRGTNRRINLLGTWSTALEEET